jgi:putative transposase
MARRGNRNRSITVTVSQPASSVAQWRWCLRDIEGLLLERGATVTCETIRCWCDKFGTSFAHRVKAARRKPGSTLHFDEMFDTLPFNEIAI